MTLRTTPEETEALRAQAEAEGRSMHDVARAAIREYIARHRHTTRVQESSARGAHRYADALERLGTV